MRSQGVHCVERDSEYFCLVFHLDCGVVYFDVRVCLELGFLRCYQRDEAFVDRDLQVAILEELY